MAMGINSLSPTLASGGAKYMLALRVEPQLDAIRSAHNNKSNCDAISPSATDEDSAAAACFVIFHQREVNRLDTGKCSAVVEISLTFVCPHISRDFEYIFFYNKF